MKKKTIVAEEEEQPRTKPPVSVPITAPAETEVAHPAAEALTSEPPHRAATVCQAFALDRDKAQNAEIEKLMLEEITATIAKHPIGQAYNLLFLYDERPRARYTSTTPDIRVACAPKSTKSAWTASRKR